MLYSSVGGKVTLMIDHLVKENLFYLVMVKDTFIDQLVPG